VDDDAGALDVFEELDAEAMAEVCAFDEAGKIGYGEGLGVGIFADLDYAEVWLEGGEGVVRDLRLGGGEPRDEGGFAHVGVTDQAGVGEETELKAVRAFFTGAAKFVFAWGLVSAGSEVLVAASAASAFGDDDGLVGVGEVVDELAGLVIVEESADGDLEDSVFPGLAGAVGAEAVAAALSFVLGVETEVNQSVVTERGGHEDVAAVAAVASGGAALGNKFFAAEGHAAVATVAGLDPDSCLINKHAISSVQACAEAARLLILLVDGDDGPEAEFLMLADQFYYVYWQT
jgi:hypothetical protein